MQLFSADAKLFSRYFFCFLTTKSWKNHPKKLLRNTQIFFQPSTAKRPKKKNSVFKMWLKESLSIALGSWHSEVGTSWILAWLVDPLKTSNAENREGGHLCLDYKSIFKLSTNLLHITIHQQCWFNILLML